LALAESSANALRGAQEIPLLVTLVPKILFGGEGASMWALRFVAGTWWKDVQFVDIGIPVVTVNRPFHHSVHFAAHGTSVKLDSDYSWSVEDIF